jgi:hypothetical protein
MYTTQYAFSQEIEQYPLLRGRDSFPRACVNVIARLKTREGRQWPAANVPKQDKDSDTSGCHAGCRPRVARASILLFRKESSLSIAIDASSTDTWPKMGNVLGVPAHYLDLEERNMARFMQQDSIREVCHGLADLLRERAANEHFMRVRLQRRGPRLRFETFVNWEGEIRTGSPPRKDTEDGSR